MTKKLFMLAAMATFLVAPITAQNIRTSLINDFERQRGNLLQIVDAMPEEGLRSAPTEGVRDFAQQIEHIVQGNIGIIKSGFDKPTTDLTLDPEVYLNSKTELMNLVNAGFDLINTMLSEMTDEEMSNEVSLFGQAQVEKWQLIQVAHEHGVWTLGQVVPYLRLNGSAPPGYNLIPGSG